LRRTGACGWGCRRDCVNPALSGEWVYRHQPSLGGGVGSAPGSTVTEVCCLFLGRWCLCPVRNHPFASPCRAGSFAQSGASAIAGGCTLPLPVALSLGRCVCAVRRTPAWTGFFPPKAKPGGGVKGSAIAFPEAVVP